VRGLQLLGVLIDKEERSWYEMRRFVLVALIAALLPMSNLGQDLHLAEQEVLESARSRYYNLEAQGFQSAKCAVNFDFSTVPSLPLEDKEASYALIKAARFSLNLEGKSPEAYYSYPTGASDTAKKHADPLANLLKSLVLGLFQTWISKGLHGPIPAFNSQIDSIARVEGGYRLTLNVPGGPGQVEMDESYLVRRIVTVGGKIDERPVYASTPDGFVFAENVATDESEAGGKVEVRYELENKVVDGLRLPASVRLRVNQNIDVRFSLVDCAVQKATVIHAKPPEANALGRP
jgi:hypothetical protein